MRRGLSAIGQVERRREKSERDPGEQGAKRLVPDQRPEAGEAEKRRGDGADAADRGSERGDDRAGESGACELFFSHDLLSPHRGCCIGTNLDSDTMYSILFGLSDGVVRPAQQRNVHHARRNQTGNGDERENG